MKKRVKTAKDVKIDEIIKLVGQVNANNKKFNDSNDKYAKKRRHGQRCNRRTIKKSKERIFYYI